MLLKNITKEYAFVSKIDVSDLDASSDWYQKNLGLIPDSRYDTPSWRQFNLPDLKRVALGLNFDSVNVGTGGAVLTFVVNNILDARQQLVENKVPVSPIIDVGHDVKLCFFHDPDGNSLGLRQNAGSQPPAEVLGYV
ncbi:VOC family protein [Burkholderia oklahomensis]|uniref:VOC family protein n=1 Tax=Burkholderia oklahomensis TaxID=342113 RepID=UPI0026569D6D|nr:VOC family protein [Burkholderia oklahomensis]MDN7676412.1 VOC family protein [Burkholderia oklahomensis]